MNTFADLRPIVATLRAGGDNSSILTAAGGPPNFWTRFTTAVDKRAGNNEKPADYEQDVLDGGYATKITFKNLERETVLSILLHVAAEASYDLKQQKVTTESIFWILKHTK